MYFWLTNIYRWNLIASKLIVAESEVEVMNCDELTGSGMTNDCVYEWLNIFVRIGSNDRGVCPMQSSKNNSSSGGGYNDVMCKQTKNEMR